MASYREEVDVVINTKVKGSLRKSITQLEESLDTFDDAAESINDLEDSLNTLDESFADSIDADSIQDNLDELDELEIKPKLASTVNAQNKQALKNNTNKHIRELSEETIDLTASLSGDPDVSTGKGRVKIETNKHIRQLNEGLTNLEPRIDGEVKWGNNGSNWAAAQGSYNRKIRSWEKNATLKEIEPKIGSKINLENLQDFEIPDSVSDDIEEVTNLVSAVKELNEENADALEKAQELRKAKEDLSGEQENLGDESENTKTKIDSEAKSFSDALDNLEGGNGLARAKRAAADSNKYLASSADETVDRLQEELTEMELTREEAENLAESLGIVGDHNRKVAEDADNTRESVLGEEESFEQAIDSAENLTDVKNSVSKANKYLSSSAIETAKAKIREKDSFQESEEAMEAAMEMMDDVRKNNEALGDSAYTTGIKTDREAKSFQELSKSADSVAEMKNAARQANTKLSKANTETADTARLERIAMDNMGLSAIEAADLVEDLTDQFRESSEQASLSSSTMRSLARNTDRTTDSMRAAAEVGDVFEDGLGSLSVNLGAFTVALRNFLTQVPLLLTALGSAGAAALGAASGFVALAGAMAGVVAVGLIAHAQQLNEEFSELDGLGESFNVIMMNLRDTMLRAAGPILENAQVIQFFKDGVQAAAFVVNELSVTLNELTESSGSVASSMYSVSDAMTDTREQLGPAFTNLVNELGDSFVILGEKAVSGTARATNGLASAIEFSTRLVDQIEDMGHIISQFGDTIADLAVLGSRIGGGLIPVFETFAVIIEDIAEKLNTLDGQLVENAVTFLAVFAGLNRVSGILGSMLKIFPNVIVGMGNISSSAAGASGAIRSMSAATSAAATQLGGFLAQTSLLGGFTNLAAIFGSTGDRLQEIAFTSTEATATFRALAGEVDNSADELQQAAIQGKLYSDVLKELDDDVEIDIDRPDIDGKETKRIGDLYSGERMDFNTFLPDSPLISGIIGSEDDASDEANRIFESFNRTASDSLEEAESPLKMFSDDEQVLTALRGKMGSLRNSVYSIKDSAIESALSLRKSFGGAVSTLTTKAAAAKSAIFGMNFSLSTFKNVSITAAIRSYALAAANTVLAAASYIASSSLAAMAATAALATGAILLLVGIIGGLAVGIIANFESIKQSASDTFGLLKQLLDIVVDVLVTYFIAAWENLHALFVGVMQGLSPLIGGLRQLAEALGLVSSEGESGGGMLEKVGGAAEFIKDAISVVSDVIQGLIGIFSGLLTILSTVIRIGLMPLIMLVRGAIAAFDGMIWVADYLIQKILGLEDGLSGLSEGFISFFSDVMDTVRNLPSTFEKYINMALRFLDRMSERVKNITGGIIDFGEFEEIDITQEAGVSRADVSSGMSNARDFVESRGSPSISYEEKNETNVNQTINADPEDKATVSRVVEDAIERANRFDRTRAGQ